MRDTGESDPRSAPVAPLGGARFQRVSVITMVCVAFVGAAWVAAPLWSGLLLGVLTAFALEPIHRRMVRRFPEHRAFTAALLVFFVATIALGFVAGLSFMLVREALTAAQAIRASLHGFTPTALLTPRARSALATFGITGAMLEERALHLADGAAEFASKGLGVVLGSSFAWLAGALIALVTAFYTLRDRRPIERRLEQLLPLDPRTTRELAAEFRLVGRGTLIGSALAGIVQGTLATMGFMIAGVPRALLLGALTAVASLLPIVGTLVVWVPVAVVLLASGHVAGGIFVLCWGALVVSMLVDYVIRPLVAGSETRSHPLMFLIGLIGGVDVFGAVGIIAGPIIMALFASALRIYRREVVEPIRGRGP